MYSIVQTLLFSGVLPNYHPRNSIAKCQSGLREHPRPPPVIGNDAHHSQQHQVLSGSSLVAPDHIRRGGPLAADGEVSAENGFYGVDKPIG